MANTMAQSQLTPLSQLGFTKPRQAPIAPLQALGALPDEGAGSYTNMPPMTYIDPVTGQLVVMGPLGSPKPGALPAQNTPAPGQVYDWNADVTAVGSMAHRRQQDPDFWRPDSSGR